jgi:glucans biosynthesis protein C
MTARSAAIGRRYGLDWLRIVVFSFLILVHIIPFFTSTDWQITPTAPVEWLRVPQLAFTAWRMTLLFVISGVASRFLINKGQGGFGWRRTVRLLPALVFGTFVIVAPQAFINAKVNFGYQHGFWWFYTHDYFTFSKATGLMLPTWAHLWFVAYMLTYSLILAMVLQLPARYRAAMQPRFDRIFTSWRLLVVPLLYLCAAKYILARWSTQTYAFIDDWHAHTVFFACFAFGVGMARSTTVWSTIAANWRLYGGLAIAAFGFVAFKELSWPAESPTPQAIGVAYDFAREVQRWGTVLALFGMADRYWHHDNAARRYLTEAVFPYYIAHQLIIIMTIYWMRTNNFGILTTCVVAVVATIVGCGLFYELVKRSGPFRPLFGLPWQATQRHGAASRTTPGGAGLTRAENNAASAGAPARR